MPDLPADLDPRDLDDFPRLDSLLRTMAPVAEPPPGLRKRTLRAVASAEEPRALAPAPPARRPHRRLRLRLAGGLAGVAAALVLALVVGGGDERPAVELRAALSAPGRSTVAGEAEVVKTGIGREIAFRTDALPILPRGEYYELWFVGPGDRPGDRNRISAGTFHPDEQGRSHARFTAAVDPAKYPRLSVTAEPGDGDPSPSDTEVLRSVGS